jgi:hypothetical protein
MGLNAFRGLLVLEQRGQQGAVDSSNQQTTPEGLSFVKALLNDVK